MVLKRKAPAIGRRRRGGMRKRMRFVRRIPRGLKPAIMAYKRKFYLESWQPNTTSISGYWRQYNQGLNNLPNNTEITALFDQYKVNAIKLQFIPRFDNFAGNNTTDTTLPGVTNQSGTYAHVCYDTRSTITPAGIYNSSTLNTFMEQGRVKTYNGNRPFTVYYRPVIVTQYGGVNTQMYVRSTWLPTNNPITLYGPHVFMQDYNFNGTFGNSYDIYVTFYMMCRNMK